MKFDHAVRCLDGIPYTSPAKGKFFYDLVQQERPREVLELGFAHGVSTCYFGAAAQELGNCHVTAVDIEASRDFKPSIEDLVEKTQLSDVISIRRESRSYTWFLKKEIEIQTQNNVCRPKYDLIFIDGPKDWTNDGCAFFLADKLLKPEGMILFDDYNWSYRGNEIAGGKKCTRGYVFENMSEQEFREPQIRKVFELLVTQHPAYSRFEVIDDQMAMARKTSAPGNEKELIINTRFSIKYRILARLRKLAGRS